MKGNFSRIRFERKKNFAGVMHQQGKVLLDRDWNEQVDIQNEWQRWSGRDVVGAGLAAVPYSNQEGFKVIDAKIYRGSLDLHLHISHGRIWADGQILHHSMASEYVKATPLDENQRLENQMLRGNEFAVILETWKDTINGFQDLDLLEPALGGADTTERIQNAYRFRYQELPFQKPSCSDVRKLIQSYLSTPKGRLTVTIKSSGGGTEECPMDIWRDYTGLEHRLYRIEITDTPLKPGLYFKMSRYNGELVGRGQVSSTTDSTIEIKGNLMEIKASKLEKFYIDVIGVDSDIHSSDTYWKPLVSGKAELSNNNVVITDYYLGSKEKLKEINTENGVYFRIWEKIHDVKDFIPSGIRRRPGEAVELEEGICLSFDIDGKSLLPGDYWLIPVRSSDMIESAEGEWVSAFGSLPTEEEPHGIKYTQVPLAIVSFDKNSLADPKESSSVFDCRVSFPPLAMRTDCTTYFIGGDDPCYPGFGLTVEEAYQQIKQEGRGGEIKLLPGRHYFNLRIDSPGIKISGCGPRTLVFPRSDKYPIFDIRNTELVRIQDMSLKHTRECAITVNGETTSNIDILRNYISSSGFSTESTSKIIRHLDEKKTPRDILEEIRKLLDRTELTFDTKERILRCLRATGAGQDTVDVVTEEVEVENVQTAICIRARDVVIQDNEIRGGILVAGGSEEIRIIDNIIHDCTGNGIILGDLVHSSDLIAKSQEKGKEYLLGENLFGFLYDILIDGNEITQTAKSGIGVGGIIEDADYPIDGIDDPYIKSFLQLGNTVVNLQISNNHIHHCLTDYSEINETVDSDELRRGIVPGGISILSCDRVLIRNNLIEENGLWPVCGIYIRYVEDLEILENKISNSHTIGNAVKTIEIPRLLSHNAGGIIIDFAVAGLDASEAPSPNDDMKIGIVIDKPALRIHCNTVRVGYGYSLFAGAYGPVSITNNCFSTKATLIPSFNTNWLLELASLTDSPYSILRALGGSVLVFNLGGLLSLINSILWLSARPKGSYVKRTSYESTINLLAEVDPNPQTKSFGILDFIGGALRYLINGNIIFNDNQVFCGRGARIASQILVTLDDMEFIGNQCDVLMTRESTHTLLGFINTVLVGVTSLRATSNRFKENVLDFDYQYTSPVRVIVPEKIVAVEPASVGLREVMVPRSLSTGSFKSLWSISEIMNNTSMNQGDHCILKSVLMRLFTTTTARNHEIYCIEAMKGV